MNLLLAVLKFLEGKKTFACALGLFVVSGLEGTGHLDSNTASVLKGLLGAGGLAALRASMPSKE